MISRRRQERRMERETHKKRRTKDTKSQGRIRKDQEGLKFFFITLSLIMCQVSSRSLVPLTYHTWNNSKTRRQNLCLSVKDSPLNDHCLNRTVFFVICKRNWRLWRSPWFFFSFRLIPDQFMEKTDTTFLFLCLSLWMKECLEIHPTGYKEMSVLLFFDLLPLLL